MARTKEEIFSILDSHKEAIKRVRVSSLSLFGSAVRGEETAGSDLDFVVEFDDLTFDNYMDLKFFLEDLFSCRVDLVIEEDIKPLLRPIIAREMIQVPGL